MSISDDSGIGFHSQGEEGTEIKPETAVTTVGDVTATDAIATVNAPALAEETGVVPNIDPSTSPHTSDEAALPNEEVQDKSPTGDMNDMSDGEDINQYDEVLRNKYSGIERRRQLAPKRLKQHNQYVNILEERVSLLEERCDSYDMKLQKEGEKVKAPEPISLAKKDPYLQPGLAFKHWKDFTSPNPPTHVIDVLVGEPSIQNTEKFRRRKTSKILEGEGSGMIIYSEDKVPNRSADSKEDCNISEEIEKMKSGLFPERIRFNGNALLWILRKVFSTSVSLSPDNILLRPFKPLLQRFDETQEAMSDISLSLKRVIERRSNPGGDRLTDATESTTNPPPIHPVNTNEEPSSAPDAISIAEWDIVLKELGLFHCCSGCTQVVMSEWPTLTAVEESFATLRELLGDYLLPAHQKFRDHKVTRVRFCDLWHLFLTGDTIVTKESGVRADNETRSRFGLKVLLTSGGRPIISTASPAPYVGVDVNSRLRPTTDPVSPSNGINPFCIHAYYLDYNGSKLVPVQQRFIIPPYPNERSITELDVFPIEYAGDVREALVKRGEKFKEYVEARPVKYLDCKGLELRTREELNDKVIVDIKGYFSTTSVNPPEFVYPDAPNISETSDCFLGGECTQPVVAACIHRTLRIILDQISDIQIFTDYIEGRPEFNTITGAHIDQPQRMTDFEICHYRLFAYKLRSREWVEVDVQSLEPLPETDNKDGFKKLVLPPDHKQILKSQVHEHFRKRELQVVSGSTEDDMDLVRGKGQGLIILLHGAPGVGKTCTAECIAELVKKPLYPITCGDLGSSAEDVEKNLKKHFTLASKWDCVMLLDEADVFLAKRKTEDLRRNSIVSVFLRILEYYKGLLFLTTNRVGTFDEAFKSRVHISLFYPNFDETTTIKVWKTFIKQTKSVLKSNGRTNVHINSDEIKSFARKHWDENPKARWNGRQIRNAFHTAVAMAEFNARERGKVYDQSRDVEIKIGKEQFEKIAKTASEFDSYMAETMGSTFEAYASKAGFRTEKEQKKKSEPVGSRKSRSNGRSGKKSSKSSKKEIDSESDSDDYSSGDGSGRNGTKKFKGKIESDGSESEEDSD